MKNDTWATAFLLRKTSLTVEDIGKLGLKQFQDLLEEVYYQEAAAEYQTVMYLGNILAGIANTVHRKNNRTYKAEDIIKVKPPKRASEQGKASDKEELEALAQRFDIRLPGKEIKDL